MLAVGAGGWLTACGGGGGGGDTVQPDSRALPFWQLYYSAKSARDADALTSLFGAQVVYEDNTLRSLMEGDHEFIRHQWEGLFSVVPRGPRAVLNRVAGTMSGAAVESTDEAGFFTSVPLNGLSIVDLKDGLIVRMTDYWDSAQLSEAEWSGFQAAFSMSPGWHAAETGDHPGTGNASFGLQSLVERFVAACSTGNSAAASAFFHPAGSYQCNAMGLSAQGGAAIAELFGALVPVAPDGLGVKLTHVVGNELGGGFEWVAASAVPGAVLRGATAIELVGGLIARVAVYFDSRLMDEGQKRSLPKI